MKKTVTICVLLGLFVTVFCQYNTQLIDSTKVWSIADQQ